MKFDVHVELSGMCLFHYSPPQQDSPGTAANGDPPKKAVTVLLVNAMGPAPGKYSDDCRGKDKSKLQRHEPRLYYREPDLKSGTVCANPHDEEGWKFCAIEGQEVTVGSGDGSVQVPYAPIQGRYNKPYMDGDEKECQWIVDLPEVLRKAGVHHPKLKSSCLADDLPNREVVTRVHLTEGKLQSTRIGMDDTGKPIVWFFRDEPGDTNAGMQVQALTEEVRLVIPEVEDHFEIQLEGSDGQQRVVELAPSDDQPLKVRIKNRFWNPNYHKPPLHLQHFRWLYNLVKPCPDKHPAPYSTKRPAKEFIAGNAFCPPASWDDS